MGVLEDAVDVVEVEVKEVKCEEVEQLQCCLQGLTCRGEDDVDVDVEELVGDEVKVHVYR